MIQGYSHIPFFLFNLMLACNTFLSVVFVAIHDLTVVEGEVRIALSMVDDDDDSVLELRSRRLECRYLLKEEEKGKGNGWDSRRE